MKIKQQTMQRQNSYIILILICFFSQSSFGQDTLRLSRNEFLAIVKNYHPMAFKYRLENRIAAAGIQQAKGNFDPVLDAKTGEKTIDGTQYYQQRNIGLGIPTWYGIEVNGSYSYLDGEKLNNSDTRGGLYQVGVTVPLAKNLLYDKRRALLEQAQIAQRMTEAEQTVLTNELMLEAENSYWEWVKQYELYLLQRETVNINKERLALVIKTFQYGEQAAIDTTEALSQLQNYELEQQDAYLQFVSATQKLSVYLWEEDLKPYPVTEGLIPSERLQNNTDDTQYTDLLAQVDAHTLNGHASVRYYDEKGKILESERRLKLQSLLPKIDFSYNFYNKEGYTHQFFPLFDNNFQYGLKLEIPIFLRQARADYKMAKLKIDQNSLDLAYKSQELATKITGYKNEIYNYWSQIGIATKNMDNYKRLLMAEQSKYANGESSLFLINSRENKLIDAQEKILELRLKFLKSYNKLKWTNANFDSSVALR
ncbi:TolC family protein [Sphingobacterium anhuiense]|uniref:TolC family protein n=1 Tax=Sphingobacterium anhuiense TaxID=493780 RepID=A0ABW5YWV9_9SPHI